MRIFLGILMVGIILVCGVSLWAETVTTYEILPGNTTVKRTVAISEILTLEEVLFEKDSLDADIDSIAVRREENYVAANETIAARVAERTGILAVLGSMEIPQ